jgi:Ca2+-transporting ATPase
VAASTAAFVAWMIGHVVLAAHMRAERQPLLQQNLLANRPFLVWACGSW